MIIVFRVDASLEIGAGHVMRCLTLARALRERTHRCIFISREHPGNLNAVIQLQGFELFSLPMAACRDVNIPHSSWLGASQLHDAKVCQELIQRLRPDWLVVDHYALDELWECAVAFPGCQVLAIDDLADRMHRCDVLLDQNLGKQAHHYKMLVPPDCVILTGPGNALLRPEFATLRDKSLARRASGRMHHILISLGGVDLHNHTGAILEALKYCDLSTDVCFTVVMGSTAPHVGAIETIAKNCPWPTRVLCGIDDMAERMVAADLAIGAGGGTSWERCCLGVPTLLMVLAENQAFASNALRASGAVELIECSQPLVDQLGPILARLQNPCNLKAMSDSAAKICDGHGVDNLVRVMEE